MNFRYAVLFTLALFTLPIGLLVAAEPRAIEVDADFPGGNLIVERIDGDDIYIKQDLQGNAEWWFYYSFRVRGAAGRELTFHWTNKSPMTTLGPAVSTDGGETWNWLGKQRVQEDSFTYRFAKDVDDVRFCLAIPYQLADLERFIERHRKHPNFQRELHATSARGRPIHRLRVGNLEDPKFRVLLTARHHACEMLASYVLEGMLEAALADDPHGRWLREHVEILAVPMMDIDGVEDGEQGKNRAPHDHNRDYEGEPRYASVAANKKFVPQWSQEKLRVAIDLHCPTLSPGKQLPGNNEEIFFVGVPYPDVWKNTQTLSFLLESVQQGPLRYSPKHNLPYGVGWNKRDSQPRRSFGRWAASLPGIEVATTLEFPYAVADGQPMTRDAARAFGRDLALAVTRYLQLEAK